MGCIDVDGWEGEARGDLIICIRIERTLDYVHKRKNGG